MISMKIDLKNYIDLFNGIKMYTIYLKTTTKILHYRVYSAELFYKKVE